MAKLKEIIEVLEELKDDSTTPKNVKLKLDEVIDELKNDEETSVKIHNSLNILDDLAEDSNLESFTRSQLWNIMSLLEASRP